MIGWVAKGCCCSFLAFLASALYPTGARGSCQRIGPRLSHRAHAEAHVYLCWPGCWLAGQAAVAIARRTRSTRSSIRHQMCSREHDYTVNI